MTEADPSVVSLRAGETVSTAAAMTIWQNIRAVWDLNPAALAEAAMIARDPDYRIPGDAEVALLEKYALLDRGGRMHDICRAIMLAATTGSGTGLRLEWPFAEDRDG